MQIQYPAPPQHTHHSEDFSRLLIKQPPDNKPPERFYEILSTLNRNKSEQNAFHAYLSGLPAQTLAFLPVFKNANPYYLSLVRQNIIKIFFLPDSNRTAHWRNFEAVRRSNVPTEVKNFFAEIETAINDRLLLSEKNSHLNSAQHQANSSVQTSANQGTDIRSTQPFSTTATTQCPSTEMANQSQKLLMQDHPFSRAKAMAHIGNLLFTKENGNLKPTCYFLLQVSTSATEENQALTFEYLDSLSLKQKVNLPIVENACDSYTKFLVSSNVAAIKAAPQQSQTALLKNLYRTQQNPSLSPTLKIFYSQIISQLPIITIDTDQYFV